MLKISEILSGGNSNSYKSEAVEAVQSPSWTWGQLAKAGTVLALSTGAYAALRVSGVSGAVGRWVGSWVSGASGTGLGNATASGPTIESLDENGLVVAEEATWSSLGWNGISTMSVPAVYNSLFVPSACQTGLVAGALGALTSRNPLFMGLGSLSCLSGVQALPQADENIVPRELPAATTIAGSKGGGELIPRFRQLRSQTNPEIGEEFIVNTNTTGTQLYPVVAGLNNGKFVIAWVSPGQDGSGLGIFSQMYHLNGTRYGVERLVNSYTAGDQSFPSITGLSDNKFVITWESNGQDGSGYGIHGQVYNTDGTKHDIEFRINTNTADDQRAPSVRGLTNGRFMVTWNSAGSQDGSLNGVYGQMYDAAGIGTGGELLINTYYTSEQYDPSVAGLLDGKAVVAWTSYGQSGETGSVHGQMYSVGGTAYGSEFKVNTHTGASSQHTEPAVAGLVDGKFVVIWTSLDQDGSSWGEYGKIYNTDGSLFKDEFQVNTYYLSVQNWPAIAALSDGKFVVTWMSDGQDGSAGGAYGQIYTANGIAYGAEFKVNTYTADGQGYPSITGLSDGGFIVTWLGAGQQDDCGIYAKIFAIKPTLKINDLTINEGQAVTITNTYLSAIDGFGSINMELTFMASNVQYGNFTLGGVFAPSFSQQNITEGKVKFVHDGGEIAPSYMISVTDSLGASNTAAAANIMFTNVNDAPIVSAIAKSGIEDVVMNFTAADFTSHYSDAESDNLTKIQIASLPAHGTLQLSSIAVSLNQEIVLANLGSLTFIPQTDWDGQTSFTWKGYDGMMYSANSAAVNLTIFNVPAIGEEFRVNTYTTSDQGHPAIALLSDGKFMVTWHSNGQDGSGFGIYAQMYNVDGSIHNPEFRVNTYTTSDQLYSAVVGLSGGKFVVTWHSDGQDGDSWGVYSQMYNADGSAYGSESQVNVATASYQMLPTIAALRNGAFVVAWQSYQAGTEANVYGRIYNANGSPYASEFSVNDIYVQRDQYNPSITGLSNGKFAVVWQRYNSPDWEIYGKIYNNDGIVWNDVSQISTTGNVSNTKSSPSITELINGKLVVTWESNPQDVGTWGVYAQMTYANSVSLYGSEIKVNTYSIDRQYSSKITSLIDGKFVVVWESNGQDGGGAGIYSQIYNADGSVYGNEFIVNTYTLNDQQKPSIAGLTNGNFVITWQTYGQDGNGLGVYAKILSISPVLKTNGLIISEGQTLTISSTYLSAMAGFGGVPGDLTFTVSAQQYGNFTLNDVVTTSFTKQNIADGKVKFVHDGGEIAPGYKVSVSDTLGVSTSAAAASISFTNVNDAPVVSGIVKSNPEDAVLSFTATDFTSRYTDAENDALTQIQITSLPAHGTLLLGSAVVNPDQVIPVANLGALTFTPDADWNGQTSFSWEGHDGTVYSTASATVNITITPVNDLPVIYEVAKDGWEDTVVNFTKTDFTTQFADIDSDSLNKIQITSLPAHGTLKLGASSVTLNQQILASTLDSLIFVPSANWNGQTSFNWKGHDGTVYSTTSATVNITVAPVNDAPVLSALSKTGAGDAVMAFNASDFTSHYSDIDGDSLARIKIITLPSNGVLQLPSHGTVTINQEVDASDLGGLTFAPTQYWHGQTSFSWAAYDGAVYSNPATATLTITAVNHVPFLNVTLDGQTGCCNAAKGQAFSFTFVPNTFTDIDGDALTYTAKLSDGSALPSWLSFNSVTRRLSGTPPVSGNFDIKITATDGGGLSVSDTFTLVVTNAAPVLGNHQLTIKEGETVTITPSMISATDADDSANSLVFTVNALHGYFARKAAGTTTIDSFTQGEIVAGNIQFVHDGGEVDPSFSISVSDGIAATTPVAGIINYTPVDDAPTVNVALATQTSCCSVAKAQQYSFTFAANTFTDIDIGDTLTYSPTQSDGSALPSWLSLVTRTFSGTPTVSGTLRLKVTATDSGGLSVSDTFVLAISNVCPVLGNNRMMIKQGQKSRVTSDMLSAADTDDSADSLIFTVVSPQHCWFELVSNVGSLIPSFNQQQVSLGQVQFAHDGSATAPGYSIRVSDGTCNPTAGLATIDFIANQPTTDSSGEPSSILPTIAGIAGAVGGTLATAVVGALLTKAYNSKTRVSYPFADALRKALGLSYIDNFNSDHFEKGNGMLPFYSRGKSFLDFAEDLRVKLEAKGVSIVQMKDTDAARDEFSLKTLNELAKVVFEVIMQNQGGSFKTLKQALQQGSCYKCPTPIGGIDPAAFLRAISTGQGKAVVLNDALIDLLATRVTAKWQSSGHALNPADGSGIELDDRKPAVSPTQEPLLQGSTSSAGQSSGASPTAPVQSPRGDAQLGASQGREGATPPGGTPYQQRSHKHRSGHGGAESGHHHHGQSQGAAPTPAAPSAPTTSAFSGKAPTFFAQSSRREEPATTSVPQNEASYF